MHSVRHVKKLKIQLKMPKPINRKHLENICFCIAKEWEMVIFFQFLLIKHYIVYKPKII